MNAKFQVDPIVVRETGMQLLTLGFINYDT